MAHMEKQTKYNDPSRPLMTVIRNPTLLPVLRADELEEKQPEIKPELNRPITGTRMPQEPTGYIKTRKHDFF